MTVIQRTITTTNYEDAIETQQKKKQHNTTTEYTYADKDI